MEVRNLSKVSFDDIVNCFLLAFENYYVKFPSDKEYYRQRWKAAKVDFNLSYGMFDNDKLIGFIIHAVDKRFSKYIAFNTGTGVIPEHRGKRIVKSIYNYALTDLKQNGIEKSVLEVITKNEKAIKAYESVGFKICKEYMCYSGAIKSISASPLKIKEFAIKDFNIEKLPNQKYYSWDFQLETILGGNYTLYQVMDDNIPVSYFIINPKNKYLAQFDILNEDKNGLNNLFHAIKQIQNDVKIINVDKRLTDKHKAILQAGLENTINQFEMQLNLME